MLFDSEANLSLEKNKKESEAPLSLDQPQSHQTIHDMLNFRCAEPMEPTKPTAWMGARDMRPLLTKTSSPTATTRYVDNRAATRVEVTYRAIGRLRPSSEGESFRWYITTDCLR